MAPECSTCALRTSRIQHSFPDAPAGLVTFVRDRRGQALDLPAPVQARYARIRILSEVNGKHWASAAEIGLIVRER